MPSWVIRGRETNALTLQPSFAGAHSTNQHVLESRGYFTLSLSSCTCRFTFSGLHHLSVSLLADTSSCSANRFDACPHDGVWSELMRERRDMLSKLRPAGAILVNVIRAWGIEGSAFRAWVLLHELTCF